MNPLKITMVRSLATVTLLIAFAGCTQQREASFPDGTGEDIFAKGSIDGQTVQLTTGSGAALRSVGDRYRGTGEASLAKVVDAESPDAFKPMFKDLYLYAADGQKIPLKFKLNKRFMTAYKVVAADARLISLEADLAEPDQSVGKKLVPVFQYEVKEFGVLVRTKNDLGEETKTLKLKPTEWAEATHVQISTLAKDRKEVKAKETITNEIFVRDQLDGRLVSRQNMQRDLGVRVDLPRANSLAYTRMNGDELFVYEVVSLRDLPAEQRRLIRTGADAANSEVIECSAVNFQQSDLPSGELIPGGGDCALVLRYKFQAPSVEARRPVDVDGISSPEVTFESSDSSDARMVRITANAVPATVTLAGDGLRPTTDATIDIASVKGKEFYFRRTMQDSPNSFDYTFAGSSGNLEIVRFMFEPGRVRVVRSRPLLEVSGTNSTDLDILFSANAFYYKLVTRDSRGNPLANPRAVQANHDEEGALAHVAWNSNHVENSSSPLDYYSLESCFDGARERQVSDVDQRLATDGVLGFTLNHVYQASRGQDCAGVYQAGYFDTVQTTFTFRERVSFKRVDETSEIPIFSVPYESQKKMGFGMFTYKKNSPNSFGNTGTENTETPLASIFDLRDGAKIKYVLAGVPTDSANAELRKKIILSTAKVVADWNVAFKEALKGTPLAREGDVLELSIERADAAPGMSEEGIPVVAPKQLGDLERNYIYYIEKATSSGVIGLGGAHASPRTGKVAAASVFMYGGNILSSVEYMKRLADIKATYEERAVAKLGPVPAPAPQMQPQFQGSAGRPSLSSLAASAEQSGEGSDQVSALSHGHRHVAEPRAGHRAIPAQTLGKMAQGAQRMRGARTATASAGLTEELKAKLNPEERALYEAIDIATKRGVIADARKFETIYLESQIKHLRLPVEKMRKLRNEATRQKAVADLYARMEAANICVFEASEASTVSDRVRRMSPVDAVTHVWGQTLAHEIGHNLGLRHNFISSFDKANHAEGAVYSSVMDYLQDELTDYVGAGQQDVAALRAAYGGKLELAAGVKVVRQGGASLALDPQGNPVAPISVIDGKNYVDVKNYVAATGAGSWLNMNAKHMAKLPLRKFMFCSDEEAGTYPTCNRFDRGTTPSEIVEAKMSDYRAKYAWTNYPQDRLSFTSWGSGSYISRLFSTMIPVRQFLDETFYQLINPPYVDPNMNVDDQARVRREHSKTINSYAGAAYAAMNFFEEVIRTPEAPSLSTGIDPWKTFSRSVNIQDENGQPVQALLEMPVRRKSLRNLKIDDLSDRLINRGIEFDKVISLIMLAERRFGFPRYEADSIAISFPFFNSLIADEGTKPEDLDAMVLLKEVMSDAITPAAVAHLPSGARPMVYLNSTFKAGTTEMMRMYAVIGGMISLDVEGLEQRDNFSTLFRVMNGFSVPANESFLVAGGANAASPNVLKYWGYDLGASSKKMIGEAEVADQVVTKSAEIKEAMGKWLAKVQEIAAAEAAGEATTPEALAALRADLVTIETETNTKLALLPEAAGPRTVAELGEYMQIAIDKAAEIAEKQLLIDGFGAQIVQARIAAISQEATTEAEREALLAQLSGLGDQEAQVKRVLISLNGSKDALFTQFVTLIKGSPLVEVALSAIPVPKTTDPAASETPLTEQQLADNALNQAYRSIVPSGVVEGHRGTIFSSIQTLSQIFFQLHPEFSR